MASLRAAFNSNLLALSLKHSNKTKKSFITVDQFKPVNLVSKLFKAIEKATK